MFFSIFSCMAYILCLDCCQPKWSDLDVNLHVNNVKYVGWILEVNIFLLSCLLLYEVTLLLEKKKKKPFLIDTCETFASQTWKGKIKISRGLEVSLNSNHSLVLVRVSCD